MKRSVSHIKRTVSRAVLILCAVCVLLGVSAAAIMMPLPEKKSYTEKELLIEAYIHYLKNAESSKIAERNLTFYCETPGMGTLPMGSSMIDLSEAEKSGSLLPMFIKDIVSEKTRVAHQASIAVQQHDLVVAQFGIDAWNDVSYTLMEIEPVEGDLGYQVKSTGKLIDKAEYEKILYEYWEEIATQEGVTYSDIFLAENEPAENIANKRIDIIAKYSEDIPVELVTVSSTQTYDVLLRFDDKAVSHDGFENFHFVIDNRDGEWKVLQGLSWAEPYPENPVGD